MRRAGLCALSALIYSASFPAAFGGQPLLPASVSAALVWFAFVPLGIAVRRASPMESFRCAYLFGVLANTLSLYWITVSMQRYGNLSFVAAASVLGVIVAVLALYPAAVFWAMARFSDRAPRWLIGSLALTLLEWTRNFGPVGGFPWITPAHALFGFLPLVQIADITGTAGLNWLILAVNLVIVEVSGGGGALKRTLRPALVVSAAFSASLLYGFIRIHQVSLEWRNGEKIDVSIVQANIPQEIKWTPDGTGLTLKTYAEMTAMAASDGPSLIVWPEAAWPITVSANVGRFPFLRGLSGGAEILLGASTQESSSGGNVYRNSAFLLDSKGLVRHRYDKRRLVPYGEYVPLGGLPPVKKLVPVAAGDFSAGERVPLPRLNGKPLGILICYEVLFPELSREAVVDGAGFFVNITNDAWFGRTSGPYQHLSFGTFRAVETRRAIVRAANTGISGWFDSAGRLAESVPLQTRAVLGVSVARLDGKTFYVRFPHLVPSLSALFLLACILGAFRRRRQ